MGANVSLASPAASGRVPAPIVEMPRAGFTTRPRPPLNLIPKPKLVWETRWDDLDHVYRYGRMKVMHYRTTDAFHVQKVKVLAQCPEVVDLAVRHYPDLDRSMVPVQAEHHDDYELISTLGDVPLQAKLIMSSEEYTELEGEEIMAAERLARRYRTTRGPRKVKGYPLLDLYYHAIFKDCMEAQLVSVVDKMDGFCESLHELLAGNAPFAEPVINYCTQTFPLDRLLGKYPLIKDIFLDPANPFVFFQKTAVAKLSDLFGNMTRNGRPHTLETVLCDTGIPMYELWKRELIAHFGMDVLTVQRESY